MNSRTHSVLITTLIGLRRGGYLGYLMLLLGVTCFIFRPELALAHDAVLHGDDVLEQVSFEQRLNEEVPLHLEFRDEQNKPASLGTYLHDKPIVLALTYFECETLCPLVRNGLVESLHPLAFTVGEEFDVVVVSIDPDETPAIATTVKQEVIAQYGRANSESGWHFLTGDHERIDQLAEAIGFHYVYDSEQGEYAHASGLVLLTPTGKIARYFFGIEYPAQELRLSLVEASNNRIGTAIDQLLLLCYTYDPVTGKYSLLIMTILRAVSLVTLFVFGMLLFIARRKESHQASPLG
jgi:protein SCO1/2